MGFFVALYRVIKKEKTSMSETKTTAMFHVALDPNGKLQPIINASLPFGDMTLLQ